MGVDQLQDLISRFAFNRPVVAKAIRDFSAGDPERFVWSAVALLRDAEESPGSRFVLATLSARPDFLRILCNPEFFAASRAASLVRQAKAFEPRIERKLARMIATLQDDCDSGAGSATHCLEVLGGLCEDAAALPALRELLRSPNARIRSKAALSIGHISRNPQWANWADGSQDPRVAANAVESIWGLDTASAKEVFRGAAEAKHSRQAINGVVGLYLAREVESIRLLFRFGRHERADFRASAAWGMGRTGDPRFMKTLEDLAQDPEHPVRMVATRAMEVLRHRVEALRQVPAIPIHIPLATFQKGEHAVQIALDENTTTSEWNALHFAISNGLQPVEEFTFAQLQPSNGHLYEARFRGPQSATRIVKVELWNDRGCGEFRASNSVQNRCDQFREIIRKLL